MEAAAAIAWLSGRPQFTLGRLRRLNKLRCIEIVFARDSNKRKERITACISQRCTLHVC